MAYKTKQTYGELLRHPKWQMKRLKIFERDGAKCVLCGDNETTLHVHHIKYTKNPWDAPDADLRTVCEYCHSLVENIGKKYFPISVLRDENGTRYVCEFDDGFMISSCEGGVYSHIGFSRKAANILVKYLTSENRNAK
jgi:hypothetical protein